MKILTVAINYLPIIGGISNHIHYLNKNIKDQGIDISLLQIIENSTKSSFFHEIIDTELFPIHKLHIKDNISLFSSIKYRKRIHNFIKEHFEYVDLIHLHEFKKTEFLFYKSSYKWIWTNHSSFFVEMIEETNLKKTILKILMKQVLKNSNYIISVSSIMDAFVKKLNIKDSTFIPNGVEIEKFDHIKSNKEFTFPKNKTSVLIPARWDFIKGIHIVVEAMKTLVNDDFVFIFAGSGIGDKKYRTQINKELKNLENFIKYEFIEYEDIPKIYSVVDIILLPSLFETGGIVPLEAMASKKIILSSNVGNIPNIIENKFNGFLFQSKNIQDLVSKLLYIKENPLECKKIKENGYQFVKDNYSWDIVAKQTISLYRLTLNQKDTL